MKVGGLKDLHCRRHFVGAHVRRVCGKLGLLKVGEPIFKWALQSWIKGISISP